LACYLINGPENFVCAVDGRADPGQPCMYVNFCDPGAFCASMLAVPGCATQGCCSSFCDVTTADPSAVCLPGQSCVAYFPPGEAPAGQADVGVCTVP
jgi:hypothetical protein